VDLQRRGAFWETVLAQALGTILAAGALALLGIMVGVIEAAGWARLVASITLILGAGFVGNRIDRYFQRAIREEERK
jgi:uncharacterized protein YcfJ